VDVFVAETMALTVPGRAAEVLGVVEIRECLEGETVREALSLLGEVFELPDPYGGLRRIARRRGLGFYRPGAASHDPARAWRGFCAYVERKRGGGDLQTPVEELAARFYAPRQRAEMASISEAVWESYGRTPGSSAPREGGSGREPGGREAA
jgi:hypothetical protein